MFNIDIMVFFSNVNLHNSLAFVCMCIHIKYLLKLAVLHITLVESQKTLSYLNNNTKLPNLYIVIPFVLILKIFILVNFKGLDVYAAIGLLGILGIQWIL